VPECVPKKDNRLSRDILKWAGSSAHPTPAKSVLWSRNSLVPVVTVWVAIVAVRVAVVAVPVISIRVSGIVAIRAAMAETQVDAEALTVTPAMTMIAVMPADALAVMPAATLAVMSAAVLAVLPADALAVTPAMATAAMARPGSRFIAEAETEQRYCERGRQEHIS